MANIALDRTIKLKAAAKKRSRKLNSDPIGYALILPFYLFLAVFVLFPIAYNLYLSFTNYNLSEIKWVGWSNYAALLHDQFFFISMKNTLVYTAVTLTVTVGLGLIFAVLLNYRLYGTKWIRLSFFSPHVTSMVAVSMIWMWIYEPSHGIANSLLEALGIAGKQWLYDAKWALSAVIFTSVWKALGYNIVIYVAGLQSIPRHLYEAAAVDGAGGLRQFFHITIPQIKPITFFLIVTGLIHNFNVFEQIMIMTDGGPLHSTTTLVHQIYIRAFQQFQIGYAASLSMVMLLAIGLITAANFRFGGRGSTNA
ncbi:sugar ABC transporter permease [Paenibacillus antri]|uniref:Sugar ABC transporter permease n=1 Tax=Paenibacillus antri TaxID=2582848 RepID=A0A5R9GG96_9BACL|nr:sugar ABC transporter permease [Paenibacillus antri]TLS52408.1 sugar ABC transporter permease [Paenibacillus antri]